MPLLITILLVIVLGIITYQDFRSRSIYWILFPIGIVLCIINGLLHINILAYLQTIGFNFLFILLLLAAPIGYYRFSSDTFLAVFDKYIGLGDVLMFLVLCFCFATVNLVVFVVCSLVLILIGYGVLYLKQSRKRTIPLAGIFALATIAVFLIDLVLSNQIMLNDDIGFYLTSKLIRLP